jgi:hypothetical protein
VSIEPVLYTPFSLFFLLVECEGLSERQSTRCPPEMDLFQQVEIIPVYSVVVLNGLNRTRPQSLETNLPVHSQLLQTMISRL